MAMVVVPSRQEVQVLNEIGTALWSLIDGQRTVAEILEQLEREYEVEPAQLESDVREFIETLDQRNMLLQEGDR